jgi:nucleotide-binding universal stress UspA family protein
VAKLLATDLGLSTWLIEVIDPSWREAAPTAGDDIGESYALHHAADELRASGLDANWETLHGDDPATAIEEFSRTLGSPVIAMTTHGRSGLARVAVGSVAMSVVRRAGCPVLVSRSRGLEG